MRPNSALFSHLLTFSKFGVVGGITAGLFFVTMWLFKSALRIQYIVAVSFAYTISTSFHFLANKYFTFASTGGNRRSSILRYAVMWSVNYLITLFIVRVSVETFHLSPYIGVCCSVVITMCTGYVLSRYWVFRKTGGGT